MPWGKAALGSQGWSGEGISPGWEHASSREWLNSSGCTKFVYVSQRLRNSDRGRLQFRNARPARAVHMGSGRSNPGHTTVVPEIVSVGEVHASGHREVVQLGQGLWFHRPGDRKSV